MTVLLPQLAPVVPAQRTSGSGWCEEGPGAGAPLLVGFGGMPPEPGAVPPFEFRGLRRRVGGHGLLLRDHDASWFRTGVVDAAPGFYGLVDWLGRQITRLAPSRTVFLGNSAGGYAALAAGALLGVDEVIAFVPRSALSDDVNDALGDDRWAAQRRHALAQGSGPDDLVPLLEDAFARRTAALGARPAYRTRFRVYHAVDNELDRAHAARLIGLPETVVSAYPRGNHQLVKVLRASGELDSIVGTALGASPLRAAA